MLLNPNLIAIGVVMGVTIGAIFLLLVVASAEEWK